MASFGMFDSLLVYQFVKRLAKPFHKWPAYDTGVIDKDGGIIVPPQDRTDEQKRSFKMFDLLVRNLKLLLAKMPGGSSRLASYAAALFLLREGAEADKYTSDQLMERLGDYMAEASVIIEEIANVVGSAPGHIAGVSDQSAPRFANARVFDVDSDKVMKSRFGKKDRDRWRKYVDEDDEGEEIRQYAKKNPKDSIILKDRATGAMVYLRKKQITESQAISMDDMKRLERYADSLFRAIGVDVEFSKHFYDRVNDSRNGKQITMPELLRMFNLQYAKNGKRIANMPPDAEAVLQDMATDINSPVVFKYNRRTGLLELMAKTIMRKKSFRSPDPFFAVR